MENFRQLSSLGEISEPSSASDKYQKAKDLLSSFWSQYKYKAAIGTSLQGSGLVLLHIALTAGIKFPVFTIDTHLLFAETLEFKTRIEKFFKISIETLEPRLTIDEQEKQHGAELWARNPDLCCQMRKLEPIRRKLQSLDVWITGIRRDQSPTREAVELIEPLHLENSEGTRFIIKLNPLADWSQHEVDVYLKANGIPTNPLHEQGYPSIGCYPCTRPIAGGSHSREGRWKGLAKKECGLHTRSVIALPPRPPVSKQCQATIFEER